MKGLVSCIRRYADAESTEYFVVVHDSTARTHSLRSRFVLNLGEFGEISIAGGTVASFEPTENAKERMALEKEIEKTAGGMVKGTPYKMGNATVDEVTEKMWKPLREAMLLLSRKLAIGASIVVRFHNDVDGSSGAYALYKALKLAIEASESMEYKPNIIWRMHNSVSYSREDATSDMLVCNNYECIEKPLLVILDFGTSEESNPGIEIVRERFDVIWLDHHPVIEGFAGKKFTHYINPWNFSGDSNYTAGFLSCMFAKTLDGMDTKELEESSFIGDYSAFSKPTPGSRRIAALLDLLTSDTKIISSLAGNLNPEDIERILGDKKRSDELIAYAEHRVSEMLDLAIKSVKVYRAKANNIYVADFESIRGAEKERYPLPGRFASRLLGRIEELNRSECILLLHFGSFISARMSKGLIGKLDLLRVLNEVRNEYPDYIDSAGGHANAASIKLKSDELKKEIVKQTVELLKKELDSSG